MWFRKQRTYNAYAEIYDGLKGDRSSSIDLVHNLIKKHKGDARLVLDLACGTGSIAQGLVGYFNVMGLDSSPQMLKIARHKVPGVQFVRGNMASFKLGMSFDVVYCLHNSVNHLLGFQQWEQMFGTVAEHLVPGGLFIFDYNPIDKMDGLAATGQGITTVGNNYVITEVIKERDGHYIWDVKVLLNKNGGYLVRDEPVRVSSYADNKVADALRSKFEIIDCFKPVEPAATDDVGRIYFVCAKAETG
jgi:SAM-dependent methyltransferase